MRQLSTLACGALGLLLAATGCQNGEFKWPEFTGLNDSAESSVAGATGTGGAGSTTTAAGAGGAAAASKSRSSASTSSGASGASSGDGNGAAGAGGMSDEGSSGGAGGYTVADPTAPQNAKSDVEIGTEENGWTGAKVGWMARSRMQGGTEMESEVKDADSDLLLMATRMYMNGSMMSSSLVWTARRHKKYDGEVKQDDEWKFTDLPDETLSIGGKSVTCQVRKGERTANGKSEVVQSWTSHDVPGWMVKSTSNLQTGNMQTDFELVDFRKN